MGVKQVGESVWVLKVLNKREICMGVKRATVNSLTDIRVVK